MDHKKIDGGYSPFLPIECILATWHILFWFKILKFKISFEISNKDRAAWSTNVQHFWKAFKAFS
jgi:hypothetical protein